MKVVVDGNEFTLVDGGPDRWEVFADDNGALGGIWKGFVTRTVKRGSIRQTKRVKCWRSTNSPAGSGRSFETRRDAIRDLVRASPDDL